VTGPSIKIKQINLLSPWLMMGLVSLLGGLTACEKEPDWRKGDFSIRSLKGNIDVDLPANLLNQIVGLLPAPGSGGEKGGHGGGEHGGGGPEAAGAEREASAAKSRLQLAALPSEFSPLKIYLVAKNRGILGRENIQINFEPGGGELDLQDYVAAKNGSFYFVTEFMPNLEKATRKVFFLSNSVVRKIDGEKIGSGCDSYFDVSKFFADSMKLRGILVNTTRARHVSALVGTYFFAAVNEGKLYLARLTVRDSVERSLQCHR
jgi:hypothetical protein